MLNITPQRGAEGAKSYFARSDYYSEGQEIVGQWGGKGAVLLGLFGRVDKHAFDQLCDNRNPLTGQPLTALTRSERRVGYDFTWSAPKSVSIVYAQTGDERILDAFRASVKETMADAEADMQTRVRRGKQEHDRTTGNMVYSEFVHLTSRPVDGLPCPQLHAHCFVFNATYDAIEGKWKAGQFGKIKQDGYYWQAVQQVRFANKLLGLGYGVHATKDAFEIAGVPDSAIRRFSLRTKVIDALAEKLGITDPKAKAKLGATTREAKLDAIPYSELVERWKAMTPENEKEAIGSARGEAQRPVLRNEVHARYAAEHVFERASVVDERRLLTLALRHGIGEVTHEGVKAEANRLKLLKREEDGHVWVTTPEVLAEEKRMIGYAAGGKGACRPLAAGLEDGKAQLSDSTLSAEQKAAVAHVLNSPDRVMILRGVAGSGKTTLTREAVESINAAGKPVVMLAPSAQASRGVLRDDGFKEADTLARFMVDEKMQAGAKGGVIWLDEAGLVGSRTMVGLFDLAHKLDARVVLAGDKRQMGSVERGAALRVLEDVAGLKPAEVTDIRRQSGMYKEAVKSLSRGDAATGLAKLDELGWVKLMPVWEPYAPLARDYAKKLRLGPEAEKRVLIVCPSHAEGGKITAQVRKELKGQGLLAAQDRVVTRLVPMQWTQAERGDASRYSGEEILQFHRNSGPFKAGQRVRAREALTQPLRPGNFAVYKQEELPLAAGDLLRITANGKTKDGAHRLNNGAPYRVAGFTKSGDIALSNGWVIGKEFGHLAHGYVTTAQGAQGRTVDHVLVAQSGLSSPAASREGFYVAVSRGRKSATIYTDDRRGLLEDAQKCRPRPSATELAAKPRPQLLRRIREAAARAQVIALVAAKRALHAIPARQREPEREMAYAR